MIRVDRGPRPRHLEATRRAELRRMAPEHGYWWLAWTWENLLFACPICNRTHKKNHFPLVPGSPILRTRQQRLPGGEVTILLDPCAADDPLDHIRFVPWRKNARHTWLPVARTQRGQRTIEVLGLDRPALVTDYEDHVKEAVMPRVRDIQRAMGDAVSTGNRGPLVRAWREALEVLITTPRAQFKALSYSVLDHHVPVAERRRWRLRLSRP